MFKKVFIRRYQKKINQFLPRVDIVLNTDIPTPSARDIVRLSGIVSKVNSFEDEMAQKPAVFFKDKTVEFKNMILENYKETTADKMEIDLL